MPWVKGQSGNPAGRPKGAKQRFSQAVIVDLMEDWKQHGITVIQDVREKKPDVYLQVISRLLPTSHELDVTDSRRSVTEYSTSELAALLEEDGRLLETSSSD